MPAQQIAGTITRKSNGSIEFTPKDGALPKSPSMGDEVTISVEVTRTVDEIEKSVADAKGARAAVKEPEPAPAKKR